VETAAALRVALRHRTPEVRLAAALSLADLGMAPSVFDLVDTLHIGSEEQSRLVVELFRRLAPVDYQDILAVAADRSRPELLRLMALESLSDMRKPEVLELLEKMAAEERGDLAAQAIRHLGSLGDASAAPTIAAALKSPDWRVRVQGATAAGRLGLASLAPDLMALLGDDAWWVRHRAGEALGSLSEQGVQSLRAVGGGADDRSRRAASLALDARVAEVGGR
jgi:HEAT repeat protein